MFNAAFVLHPSLRRSVDGRVLPLVFTGLLALIALPILWEPLPPLTDYVNHLARMHVLAQGGADAILNRYYEIRWAIIPNLVMDAVTPPIARMVGVLPAGQLFLLLTAGLLAAGPMMVHRALWGRFSPWPLAAFPLIYNGIFLYGLVNYLLGVGLAVWGLAAWIALRDKSPYLRAGASALFVLTLFFCHLFSLGLYGLAVGAFEIWRARSRNSGLRALAVDGAAVLIPFLPALPLLAAGPTMALSRDNLWESRGKLEGLYLTVELYRDSVDMTFAAILIGAAVWAARRGALRLHPAGWVLAAAGALVFFAMPRQLFGSWIADQRLPVGLAFLLIGFLGPDLRGRLSRGSFYLFMFALTLARVSETAFNWADAAAITDDVARAASHLPRGAKVLTATADQAGEPPALVQALSHAPLIAVINRDALASTIFSVPGKQILNIRDEYSALVDREDGDPPALSQLLADARQETADADRYWNGWRDHYDYVFVLYVDSESAAPPDDLLDLVAAGRGFRLYRVVRPD